MIPPFVPGDAIGGGCGGIFGRCAFGAFIAVSYTHLLQMIGGLADALVNRGQRPLGPLSGILCSPGTDDRRRTVLFGVAVRIPVMRCV